MKSIDTYFKNGLLPKPLPGTATVHFKSCHTWREMMWELVDLPKWHQGTVDYYLQQGCIFYFREIKCIIKYLLRQRTFLEHLVYEPIREFDREGNQVYTHMHTGNWWWRTQVGLFVQYKLIEYVRCLLLIQYNLTEYFRSLLDGPPACFNTCSNSLDIRSNVPHQLRW